MIPNSLPGLDFGLGNDIDMLRETVGAFSREKIAPCAAEIDRTNKFPRELWPQLGALGGVDGNGGIADCGIVGRKAGGGSPLLRKRL